MLGCFKVVAIIVALSTVAAAQCHETNTKSVSIETFNLIHRAHMFAAAAYCMDNTRTSDEHRHLVCPYAACCELLSPVQGYRFDLARPTTDAAFNNFGSHDATGYVAVHHLLRKITVALRTSKPLQMDFANMNFRLERAPNDVCLGCEVFAGFHQYWQAVDEKIIGSIHRLKKLHPAYDIDVVGHSLGGAVATIVAAVLRHNGHKTNLYTFGSPRVGNSQFAGYASSETERDGYNYRVTHKDDWVSKVPAHPQYEHVPGEYHIFQGESHSKLTHHDMVFYSGREHAEVGGGNMFTSTTDYTLRHHNWFFDDISQCNSTLMEMSSWVSNGADDFSYMEPCVKASDVCVYRHH